MNLAVLTHGFPTDKNPIAANFLEPFLKEIKEKGHLIHVITPRMAGQKPLRQAYIVHTFDWGRGEKLLGQLKLINPDDLASLFRFIREQKHVLTDLHRKEGFDHVLAVWIVPNALAARALYKQYAVPYSTWSLGTDVNRFSRNAIGRSLLKGLMKDAAHLFANSKKLCEKIAGMTGKESEYLPTYRPLETSCKEEVDIDRNAFHFLCVARLEPVKGPDILIMSFSKLIDDEVGRDIQLHFLGDGTMRRNLEKQVSDAGIADKVQFHGMVNPATVSGFLNKVDCLVLPSRNESMPVSFWEAQAADVPVIGTDVGDLGWAIREFGQGIVVKPEDVDLLKDAMLRVLREGKGIMRPNPAAQPPDPRRAARRFLEVIGSG